ncbi:MAG: gliding motility lipoprotein GldD [Bacteroidetes bacterium]|nr:gliding motility lipoprotein GldD [Bacteroidota bacterium]
MKRLLPLLIILFAACGPDVYTPKPRGYYRIELPTRSYQKFNTPGFPYTFEYPTYGKITNDTSYTGSKSEKPYWINVDFPSLGGKIYLSYKSIDNAQSLNKLIEDAYVMTVEAHNKRADNIEPIVFHNKQYNVHGLFYNVSGNAASAYQFFATDSTKHFLRGALYFEVSPNADSLKPVNEFLRTDIQHILETLRWQ